MMTGDKSKAAAGVLTAPETERALIAAIMRDNAVYSDAADAGVTEATFTDQRHAKLWQVISAKISADMVADLVSISDALKPDEVQYAAESYDVIATGVNAPDWIVALRQCEGRRGIKLAAGQAMDKLLAGQISEEEFAAVIEDAKEKARTVGGHIKPLAEIAADFGAEFLAAQAPKTIPVFPAGTDLGKKLVFRQGQILVIAAGAGAGKTQIAAQAVVEQLNAGLKVLYICTETVSEEVFARLLAPVVSKSHFALLYADRSADTVTRFKAASQAIVEHAADRLAIVGIESGSLSVKSFRSLMSEAAAKLGGVDVVVVDYIQDLEPINPRAGVNDNTAAAMSVIAHTVKKYRAAAMVLSQINRVGQNAKQGEEPNLSWLKDCSKIGELANTVCFLIRNGGESTLHCVKSRDCERFTAPLEYKGAKYVSAPLAVESERYEPSYGGHYD